MARVTALRAPRPVGRKQVAAAAPDACRPPLPPRAPGRGAVDRSTAWREAGVTSPVACPQGPEAATLTETVQHWL